MALLSAVATDPHRLDDLSKEFDIPRGEIVLALSTIQKTFLFLSDRLIVLACADVYGNHRDYIWSNKKSVEHAQIEELTDEFAVTIKAGVLDLKVRVTDRIAISRLRAWLGGV